MQRHLSALDDPEITERAASAPLVCWLRTRQQYRLPGEADLWAAWRTGDTTAPVHGTAAWRRQVLVPAKWGGRTVRVVHVVYTPVTAYMRWRLECYRHTMAEGEQVKLLVQQPGRWPQGVPRQDALLLDGPGNAGALVRPQWSEGGHLEDVHLTDDPEAVAWGREVCRRAWGHPQGRLLNALPLPLVGQ